MLMRVLICHAAVLCWTATATEAAAPTPAGCSALLGSSLIVDLSPNQKTWLAEHGLTAAMWEASLAQHATNPRAPGISTQFSNPSPNGRLSLRVNSSDLAESAPPRVLGVDYVCGTQGHDPIFGPMTACHHVTTSERFDGDLRDFASEVVGSGIIVADALRRFVVPRHLKILAHYVNQIREYPFVTEILVSRSQRSDEIAETMDAFVNRVLAGSVLLDLAAPLNRSFVVRLEARKDQLSVFYRGLRVTVEFDADGESFRGLRVAKEEAGYSYMVSFESPGRLFDEIESDFNQQADVIKNAQDRIRREQKRLRMAAMVLSEGTHMIEDHTGHLNVFLVYDDRLTKAGLKFRVAASVAPDVLRVHGFEFGLHFMRDGVIEFGRGDHNGPVVRGEYSTVTEESNGREVQMHEVRLPITPALIEEWRKNFADRVTLEGETVR